jgi:hypothetical protein
MDKQTGALREGPGEMQVRRHRLVHHLTVHHRQATQQKGTLRFGQKFPEITLQQGSTHAKGMALSIQVKVRSETLTSLVRIFIQVWSRT